MFTSQQTSMIYPFNPYIYPTQRTVAFQRPPLDVNWFNAWPIIRSILIGSVMLLSSAAIIGLDIANLAIEGNKNAPLKHLGLGTAKVGAGIWSGSISFIAAIFIIVIGESIVSLSK